MSAFFLSCYLATASLTPTPQLLITQPSGKTVDREVCIQVEQLEPFQEIEIRAVAKDQKGEVWSSHAVFYSDAQGHLDVSSAHPVGNSSYEDVDAMGLFWSMLPASGDACSSFKCKNDSIAVEIQLYVDGNWPFSLFPHLLPQ